MSICEISLLDQILYGIGSDSHNRLERFTDEVAEMGWTFEELLDIYSGLDRPNAQCNFKLFYDAIERTAPEYDGPVNPQGVVALYRGTSLETRKEYGAGLCWTTDYDTAVQFASLCCSGGYRFMGATDRTPAILAMPARPEDIIYRHVNDRDEDEVLIKPYLGWKSFIIATA